MGFLKRGPSVRGLTREEKAAWRREKEKEYPGYLEENEKLQAIVRILTAVRILYGGFYLGMQALYGLPLARGLLMLLSPLFFYFWYTFMLRSGRLFAAAMLLIRGMGIVYGGVAILNMSWLLPWPLLFTMTAAVVMEFTEAVFCIYVLFVARAAMAVRLNRAIETALIAGDRPQ